MKIDIGDVKLELIEEEIRYVDNETVLTFADKSNELRFVVATKSLNRLFTNKYLKNKVQELEAKISGEFEWNLHHDMDNRSYKDVEHIKELQDSNKALLETLAQFADQLPSPKK